MEERGSNNNNNNKAFDMFYTMLKEVQASNRRNPKAASRVVRDGEYVHNMLAQLQTLNVPFSGEEEFGRYLDLHEFYNMFVNSKFGYPLTYADYLDKFPTVDESIIPIKYKGTRQYKEYIAGVLDYLVSFVNRAKPLMFLDRLFNNIESEFEVEGTEVVVGQKRPRTTTTSRDVMMEQLELEECTTLESLMDLGLDRLKHALDCLGLKSGGTLQQRAERLLLVKNTPLDKLHPTHFKKQSKHNINDDNLKAVAVMEAKVVKLCELLKDTLEQTRQHIVNKQAMTAEELAQDRTHDDDDDPLNNDSDDEDEDEKKASGNKVPLDWDGNPIPFWLFKLHGLSLEYNCEICGNYTYKGRRAFEKHFHEPRHQRGMRCLGIPNTASFHEITLIDDAKKLWDHIRRRQDSSQWKPHLYEEYEDGEGNVYPKNTYNDLLKQGLI